MKRLKWLRILMGTGVLLVMASSMAASPSATSEKGVPQLFTLESTPDRATLQRTGGDYLKRLLDNPANEQITLIKLEPALVNSQTHDLAVTLPDGKHAQFHLRSFNTIFEGLQGWVGYKASTWKPGHAPSSSSEIDIDPLYYLSLVRDGQTLIGSVIIDGQRYRIDHVGPAQHALIKIDESKLQPEGEPLEPEQVNATDEKTAKTPQSSHSVIRVLFIATNQRRAASPNYKAELANALNDANQYMRNSQVDVTFQLAAFYPGPYDETGRDYDQQLNDIRLAQPFAGEVLKLQAAVGADLVSMYSTAREFCGLAFVNPGSAQAHSVISCPSSLAHEIGHNFGAHHNWAPGDTVESPPYQYGYRYTETPRFRTQLSYGCPGQPCARVPYLSTPRLTYQGIPLGTVEHHDVARRFNEQREKFENFYPPFRGVELTLYSDTSFHGSSCFVAIPFGAPLNLASQCPSQAVRSFKVSGFEKGQSLCFYDGPGERSVCYHEASGEPPENFQVPDLDRALLIPGLTTQIVGGGLSGNVVDVLYGKRGVLLFGQADFKSPLCGFQADGQDVAVADQAGCAGTAGLARSARIFNESVNNLSAVDACFSNQDHSRTLCFKGKYQGKFGVANFDSTAGIPAEIKRTQTGSYMNGSVHRYQQTESFYPPLPPYLFNQGHQENGKPTCMVVGQNRYLEARACPESTEPDTDFIWKPVSIRGNLTISLNGSGECLAEPVGGGGFRLTGCPDPRLVVGSWLVWSPRAQTDGSFLLEWGKTPRGVCLAVDASNDRVINAPCDDTNPLQRWRWSEI
ncbi:zinc-dependent metalloprotease family protein [Pseudomonas sp. KCJK9111]|uniref:zinc-dependent metalloprotease family protein n=1 Tax=Pseudomonas sp. KCJK9111 TaxID=3344555 RepID=UPI003906BD00